jgi:hypothetical protein
MQPLGFQFSMGGLYTLTPWPIRQASDYRAAYRLFLIIFYGLFSFHTFTGVFLVHIYSVFTEHEFGFMDTEILMVLKMPQGDPIPLSRHCYPLDFHP